MWQGENLEVSDWSGYQWERRILTDKSQGCKYGKGLPRQPELGSPVSSQLSATNQCVMSFLPEYLLDCEEHLYRSFILENKQKN